MAHWRKSFNPNFFGSWDIPQGQELTLTIDRVGEEQVTGPEGRVEVCLVAHFRQKVKPLILNVTNAKVVTKVTGSPFTEDWAGKNIALRVETVQAFGETVEAVRVALKKVPTKCTACGKTVTEAGSMSAAEVAAFTTNRFHTVLCAECAKTRG